MILRFASRRDCRLVRRMLLLFVSFLCFSEEEEENESVGEYPNSKQDRNVPIMAWAPHFRHSQPQYESPHLAQWPQNRRAR